MAKEGFLRAAIEETKYLTKKICAQVLEEKTRGVQFPGHKTVKAAIQRHPAMLYQNQTSGCLSYKYRTVKNPQTRLTRKGTGAPPPARRRERIPDPTPPPPGTPPAPTSNTSGAQPAEVVNLQARYTYSHTALSWVEFFEDNEDTEHDTDFDLDTLTDEG